jgi:hypothetical protein
MTPEEEAASREAGVRTVRAKSLDPVPVEEAQRAKWRAFAVGVTVAAGASVAAAIGYMLVGKRRAHRRKHERA